MNNKEKMCWTPKTEQYKWRKKKKKDHVWKIKLFGIIIKFFFSSSSSFSQIL